MRIYKVVDFIFYLLIFIRLFYPSIIIITYENLLITLQALSIITM